MLKILYAGYLGLFLAISAQFTPEMYVTALKRVAVLGLGRGAQAPSFGPAH